MKKKIVLLPFFLLLLLVIFASCAQSGTVEESGELEFALTANGQNYKVIGIGTHRGSTVTIPELYDGKPVIYIAEGAFKGNQEIKHVIIPKTISQIYANAFDGCSSLQSVDCRSTTINMIATDVFRGTAFVKNKANYENGGLYISNNLVAVHPDANGEFRIKDGTLCIAYQCFRNTKISSLIVPSGCYHLGKFTFFENEKLENVTFEGSVGYLGEGLFYRCTALKTVDIAAGCAIINERVFFGCASLEAVAFPSNLTTVKDGAFSGCASLKNVMLPDGCQTLGNEAFLGCTSLQSIGGASSLTSVGAKAFRDCTALSVCNLPQSAVYGALAFANTPLE